jgi:hypothetical protein
MNWMTVAVVGAVAAWFEYSYRKSRSKRVRSEVSEQEPSITSASEHARVAQAGNQPSIAPGDENDRQMNAAM